MTPHSLRSHTVRAAQGDSPARPRRRSPAPRCQARSAARPRITRMRRLPAHTGPPDAGTRGRPTTWPSLPQPGKKTAMRLPLVPPVELTAAQRPLYDAFAKMTEDEEYQGFEVKNADGAFTGPWGVMLHFPDLAVPLGQFISLAQKLPALSERARQVVILTIGGQFNVAYELYAHAPLAARAGLSPDQVAALSAGARPDGLSPDELLGRRRRLRADPGRRGARAAVRRCGRPARPAGLRRGGVHRHPLPGAGRPAQRLRRARRASRRPAPLRRRS